MAFINDEIPEADVEKYGLEKIGDFLFGGGATFSRGWTIDRRATSTYAVWHAGGTKSLNFRLGPSTGKAN